MAEAILNNLGRPKTNKPKPDGTEGYASMTLTILDQSQRLNFVKTVGCFVNNNEFTKSLLGNFPQQYEDTRFFIYFFLPETNLSNTLEKAEVNVYRFNKPYPGKNCVIENKKGKCEPFCMKESHIFLPACVNILNTPKFVKFLNQYSKVITLTVNNHRIGKYQGVGRDDETNPKSVQFNVDLDNNSGQYYILGEACVFETLVDAGPLLCEESDKYWTLVGWFIKDSEQKHIAVRYLRGEDQPLYIWKDLESCQSDKEEPVDLTVGLPPGSSDQGDGTSRAKHNVNPTNENKEATSFAVHTAISPPASQNVDNESPTFLEINEGTGVPVFMNREARQRKEESLEERPRKEKIEHTSVKGKATKPANPSGTKRDSLRKMIQDLKLYKEVGTYWRFVGRDLSMKNYVLDSIEEDYRQTKERSYQMFNEWIQGSRNPSETELIIALQEAGREDLSQVVKEYCRDRPELFPNLKSLADALPVSGHSNRNRVSEDDDLTKSTQPVEN